VTVEAREGMPALEAALVVKEEMVMVAAMVEAMVAETVVAMAAEAMAAAARAVGLRAAVEKVAEMEEAASVAD